MYGYTIITHTVIYLRTIFAISFFPFLFVLYIQSFLVKNTCPPSLPFLPLAPVLPLLASFDLLSVHVPRWFHIPECLRGAGGRRRPGPSHWCGCRPRWIWSIRRSSRSRRWSTASREQLVLHRTALERTQQLINTDYTFPRFGFAINRLIMRPIDY